MPHLTLEYSANIRPNADMKGLCAKLARCLIAQQADGKARRKTAAEDLDRTIHEHYPKLSEAEIKSLVVDDKWLAFLAAAVQAELDRVSQTLTGRIRVLAERYATSLPQLTAEIDTLAARVAVHLHRRGVVWE